MKQVLGRLRRGITGAVLAGVMVPAALVLAAYVLAGRSDATTATLHADAYVGVEACVSCHQAEGNLWQEFASRARDAARDGHDGPRRLQ